MDRWIFVSGILAWFLVAICGATIWVSQSRAVHTISDLISQIPFCILYLFIYPLNLLMFSTYTGPKDWAIAIFLTPYLTVPFYWFVLHQIDMAIKRKRGAGAGVTTVA